MIQSVTAHLVTLSAGGKTYELGYPDQLGNRPAGKVGGSGAERLLNSPLGKLGLGVLGNQAGTSSRSGRSRGRHGKAAGSSP
jgi:hypothetical protein